ncbi:MAG: hypothetical protein N0A16_03205 [Blastocatellia bacterium]|nr:hypothetical protein [Blastocatellia bacterium]MCS7156723.1 hypothetical protein [Blastocatellia bacterium]MCX7751535.1 hypothetical protein [Blastocatellia bacterium]MDW8168635.1 hypothetical protein [Acidobacteriota bacterium]MDW8256530.1 hypothetical protein [Acidobacteriota bacterium]
MEPDVSSKRSFGRVRERAQAIEREIEEEFPEWPRWKQRARRWGMIGLVLVLMGIAFGELLDWLERREEIRRQRERGRVIQLISPVSEVREEIIEFVWRPSPLVDRYVVEVSDVSYRLIWRSPPVKEVELRLPEAVRRQLHRGERYLWQVRGFDASENEVASSPFEEILIVR